MQQGHLTNIHFDPLIEMVMISVSGDGHGNLGICPWISGQLSAALFTHGARN